MADLEAKLAETDKRVADADKKLAELAAQDIAKHLACIDAQRAMKAAWLEHARAASAASGFCPSGVAVCPDTGLPPRTIENYQRQARLILEGADSTFEDFQERRTKLPKLPAPTVENPKFERMAQTRSVAEAKSDAFLSVCKPPDVSTATGTPR